MRLLVPPARQNNPDMDQIRAPSLTLTPMHMEPNGPAGIVMSDGRFAACNLTVTACARHAMSLIKDKLITRAQMAFAPTADEVV